MHRRQLLAAALAGVALGGGRAMAAAIPIEASLTLREGYGWITLDHRPSARAWRDIRPYITARTRHEPGGACVSLEMREEDRPAVLALLEGR